MSIDFLYLTGLFWKMWLITFRSIMMGHAQFQCVYYEFQIWCSEKYKEKGKCLVDKVTGQWINIVVRVATCLPFTTLYAEFGIYGVNIHTDRAYKGSDIDNLVPWRSYFMILFTNWINAKKCIEHR